MSHDTANSLAGLSVLVVEDEALLRRRLSAHLEALGADVTGADTLSGAQRLLVDLEFDFVLLDIHLPDGLGTDLLRAGLAQKGPGVVVMTAEGDIKGAVGNFAAAIKVAPDDFEGYFMLSETFVHLKQYPQAIAVLSTAVHQFPENGLVYYLLAVAYESAEQPLPAIVAARRSVEIFSAKGDQDGVKRSAILLAGLIESAKKQSEDMATANAAKDAANAAAPAKVVAPSEPLSVPAVKK